MAQVVFSISKSLNSFGKGRVLARVSVDRFTRIRLKTEFFASHTQLINGAVKVPKLGRFNEADVEDAKNLGTNLKNFESAVTRILNASTDRILINKDWLHAAVYMELHGHITKIDGNLIFDNIDQAVQDFYKHRAEIEESRTNSKSRTFITQIQSFIDSKLSSGKMCENRCRHYKVLMRSLVTTQHPQFKLGVTSK